MCGAHATPDHPLQVFLSIKGIYYQAEVMGEKVTWLVGHERAVGDANAMDMTVMANFVDFYTAMLSFVNFRLYKTVGLYYPPKLHVVGAGAGRRRHVRAPF